MKTVLVQNAQGSSEAETDPTVSVPGQFQTRVGRQRFLDRSKKGKKEDD